LEKRTVFTGNGLKTDQGLAAHCLFWFNNDLRFRYGSFQMAGGRRG